VLGRPVEAIPPGQGSVRLREIRATAAGTATGAGVDLARLVNPTYGWFVGFAGLLSMAVGGGAVMLTVAAPLLLSEFNLTSSRP
jgi:hypothetical protein